MSDRANLIRCQCGSSLLEGLLAIILFSIGLLSLLMLLSATLIESSNARYRIEASLLISNLVSHMWIGDHSLNGLKTRFADTASTDYQSWFTSVSNRLPGVPDSVPLQISAARWRRYWLQSQDYHLLVQKINLQR